MKWFWLLAICIILLGAACLPGNATIPSFRGYTGLIIIPTADALGKGEWNAGFFFENVASETVNDIVVNYGIAPGLEFGIDRFDIGDVGEDVHVEPHDIRVIGDNNRHTTLLNVKYRFAPEAGNRPALAVGITDITDEIETTVYGVASKTIGCDVRVWKGEVLTPRIHVGFGGGRQDGLFAGISGYIGNRVQLMAEWDSLDVNVGARWRVTPQFTVHAGGLNLTDKEDDPFSLGASFGVGASWNMTY